MAGQEDALVAGRDAPQKILWAAVIWFAALLVTAGFFVGVHSWHGWLTSHPLGRLPTAIVWFGAIGGSLASLSGIFQHHKKDWKKRWDLWHAMRPATGAIMGALGAFFLLVSTEIAATTTSTHVKTINPDIFYAASFMAGFAEEPFRELVKRLTDALYGSRQCCHMAPCEQCQKRELAAAASTPSPSKGASSPTPGRRGRWPFRS